MVTKLRTIAFDADDTLWHNERVFKMTQDRFADLLSDHAPTPELDARLLEAERRNLGHYGFGVKGFMLSMIETAVDLSGPQVRAEILREILDMGRDMLSHPIELLPHAEAAVRALAPDHRLVLITKGDLLDQERKLAQSGLGELFDQVEIVSDKRAEVYARIFAPLPGGAEAALMVGNSLKSDVWPALQAGAWGVHVPHDLEWALEAAPVPQDQPRFREIADLSALPDLVAEIG